MAWNKTLLQVKSLLILRLFKKLKKHVSYDHNICLLFIGVKGQRKVDHKEEINQILIELGI